MYHSGQYLLSIVSIMPRYPASLFPRVVRGHTMSLDAEHSPQLHDRAVTCGGLTVTGLPEHLSLDDLYALAVICFLGLDGVIPPARVDFEAIRSHYSKPIGGDTA